MPSARAPGADKPTGPANGGATQSVYLPDFPWPPPPPSARFSLAPSLFDGAESQFDVAAVLTEALNAADYSEYVFYRAPGGFALVARLERINPDATPAPEELRFLSPNTAEPFSLYTYILRLFVAPEGLYRQIVFLVTNQLFTSGSQMLTEKEAERLLRKGANRLPDDYRDRPFDGARVITAFIYEFQKGSGDQEVQILNPGRFQGRTHLDRSGILTQLTGPRERR